MKNIILITLAFLLMCFTACNSSNGAEDTNNNIVSESVEYSFYYVPSVGGTLSTDISSKIPANINNKNFSGGTKKLEADLNKVENKNVDITIGNISHKVNYKDTYEEELFCNDRFNAFSVYDKYRGETCEIEVRRTDSKLTFFFNRDMSKYTVSGNLTEEQAKKIAKEQIVSLYGESILDEYRQDRIIRTESQLTNDYTVLYTKYVHGLPTLDDIEISINMHGELISVNALYLGVFDNSEKELTQVQIDNALKAMNENISNKCTLKAHTLTIDSEGYYYIRANGYIKGENGTEAITLYINVE